MEETLSWKPDPASLLKELLPDGAHREDPLPDDSSLVLISGPIGVGKTSWCLALRRAAIRCQYLTAGLLSPSVYLGDLKAGIDLMDATTGETHRLAEARAGETNTRGPATEAWQFSDLTIYWGNTILDQIQQAQLVLIDEIGPLELERGLGLQAALGLIEKRFYWLGMVVVRPSLLSLARQRWPWAMVIHIERGNQDG
jgi:nucleoside-triphosphatase THEP1